MNLILSLINKGNYQKKKLRVYNYCYKSSDYICLLIRWSLVHLGTDYWVEVLYVMVVNYTVTYQQLLAY